MDKKTKKRRPPVIVEAYQPNQTQKNSQAKKKKSPQIQSKADMGGASGLRPRSTQADKELHINAILELMKSGTPRPAICKFMLDNFDLSPSSTDRLKKEATAKLSEFWKYNEEGLFHEICYYYIGIYNNAVGRREFGPAISSLDSLCRLTGMAQKRILIEGNIKTKTDLNIAGKIKFEDMSDEELEQIINEAEEDKVSDD